MTETARKEALTPEQVQREMEENITFATEQYRTMQMDHPREWVLVDGQRIVAHDTDPSRLLDMAVTDAALVFYVTEQGMAPDPTRESLRRHYEAMHKGDAGEADAPA